MRSRTEWQLRWLTYAGSLLALSAIVLVVVLGSKLNSSMDRVLEDLAKISDIHTVGVRIAYVDAEEVFATITAAVSYQRQRAIEVQNRITKLQQEYQAGNVSTNEYHDKELQLQIELLMRKIEIDVAAVDRMLESELFSHLHTDLKRLKDKSQPLIDSSTDLYAMAQASTERKQLEEAYSKIHELFEEFDKLSTQAATNVIVKLAKAIALERGYDIVLRSKNVIVYGNTDKLVDITEAAKLRMAELMP